ncbi:hypothetical protein QQ045_023403 [Rhodiola kirilowii]
MTGVTGLSTLPDHPQSLRQVQVPLPFLSQAQIHTSIFHPQMGLIPLLMNPQAIQSVLHIQSNMGVHSWQQGSRVAVQSDITCEKLFEGQVWCMANLLLINISETRNASSHDFLIFLWPEGNTL